jgi:hypothetical protein
MPALYSVYSRRESPDGQRPLARREFGPTDQRGLAVTVMMERPGSWVECSYNGPPRPDPMFFREEAT